MTYDNSGGRYNWMKRAETNMRREMEQGGPTSDAAAHALLDAMRAGQKVNETQNAIIPYIEKMATVLAEAARSSAQAGQELSQLNPGQARLVAQQIGTDPLVTLERWLDVLRKETTILILEAACDPPNPTKKKTLTTSLPNSVPTIASQQPGDTASQAPRIASSAIKDDSSGSK